MADNNQEEEPSIEEILDSIRQIISDDEDDVGVEETPAEEDEVVEEEVVPEPQPEPEPESEIEEEIIELTEKVEDKPVEEEAVPNPEPVEESIEIDMTEPEEPAPADEPVAKPEPEPVVVAEPIPAPPQVDEELLTDKAEKAAHDGFSDLVKRATVEKGGITLEEIVRDELRPLLREWLDSNLPSLIERLVEEELRRISKAVIGD